MADDTSNGDAGNGGGENGGGSGDPNPPTPEVTLTPEEEQIVASAQNPDAVRNAIRSEREARSEAERAAAEARAEIERRDREAAEADQTAEQKAQAADERAKTAERKAQQYEAAAAAGLPLDFAPRLQGDDLEALTKDAEALKEKVGSATPPPNLDGGARGNDEPRSVDDQIRSGFGRR